MGKSRTLVLLAFITSFAIISCDKSEDDIKLFPIKSGEKWGYVDKEGNYVINSQFEEAYNFADGLALFKSQDGKYGFISEDGKYAINPIYKDATTFSEGLACVVMENGKPQFINKENKIIFTVDNADFCFGFSEGMARIKVKGKWGFIDKMGKVIINPIYDNAMEFKEGLALVSKIDETSKEKSWGFIDKLGAVKINFQFINSKDNSFCLPGSFNEGLAYISSDGKQWGYINKEGKYQINPQFDGCNYNSISFKNGLTKVNQGGSYGFIDKTGKYVVNPQFKNAYNFASNGLAAVEHSDGKWGFINKEGKYEINPQFEEIVEGFYNGIAFVKSSDKFGIIDSKGLYIVNPQFDGVKLYDIGLIMGVESDYIDYIGIAEQLFDNSSDKSFLGYTEKTTLGEIIDDYPNVDVSDLREYRLDLDQPNISVNKFIDLGSLTIGFREKTFSETPIYKTVRKYSYYSGYYNDKEFDRMEKKVKKDIALGYQMLLFDLKSYGKTKGRELAEALKNTAVNKLKVTEIVSTDYKNTDLEGMFLMKNDNLLAVINYVQKEAFETNYPSISIMVITPNLKSSFDELQENLIENFNED